MRAAESIGDRWQAAFRETLRDREAAEALRDASLAGRLADWTSLLTALTVRACEGLGWQASAKGHQQELLPEGKFEYLSLDVMAFAEGTMRWRYPVAAMELENSRRDDRVAYSLWKVLCVRAQLRVVFCYRADMDEGTALVRHLEREVVGALTVPQRLALEGETLVVVGSRGKAETFPNGFFRWWWLEPNTGTFVLQ